MIAIGIVEPVCPEYIGAVVFPESAPIEPVVVEFYLGVTRCPDGIAAGAMELRTRGHNNWPEITAWPKNEHFRLTTDRESGSGGLGAPEPVKLNETEKQMCAIFGLNELELHVFLREWTPQPYERNKERPQTVEEVSRALSMAGKERKSADE